LQPGLPIGAAVLDGQRSLWELVENAVGATGSTGGKGTMGGDGAHG
jgi:hypothetical protein